MESMSSEMTGVKRSAIDTNKEELNNNFGLIRSSESGSTIWENIPKAIIMFSINNAIMKPKTIDSSVIGPEIKSIGMLADRIFILEGISSNIVSPL